MTILASADLHLTDKPNDDYRWPLFEWLGERAFKNAADAIILAGDITDAKDRHSATLTNRLVSSLRALSEEAPIYILRGNHDYVEEAEPFFGFMNGIDRIEFVTKPRALALMNKKVLLLPNTRDYQEAWSNLNFDAYDLIFCHQTFDGSMSETGYELAGIPPSVFKGIKGQVYSGDIHVPQKVSRNIEYIGAPYRIRYGDSFQPRVLLIKDDMRTQDLHFPAPLKATLAIMPGDVGESMFDDFSAGDQIKVRVSLPRAAFPDWPEIKREIIEHASKAKIALAGPELIPAEEKRQKAAKVAGKPASGRSPLEAMEAYAQQKQAPAALLGAGRGILKEAIG